MVQRFVVSFYRLFVIGILKPRAVSQVGCFSYVAPCVHCSVWVWTGWSLKSNVAVEFSSEMTIATSDHNYRRPKISPGFAHLTLKGTFYSLGNFADMWPILRRHFHKFENLLVVTPFPLRIQDGDRWGWEVSIILHSTFWLFGVHHATCCHTLQCECTCMFKIASMCGSTQIKTQQEFDWFNSWCMISC